MLIKTESQNDLKSSRPNESPNQVEVGSERVGNIYQIAKQILSLKGPPQSALLLLLLDREGRLGQKITKKSCQELLNASPTSALKGLESILDLTTGTVKEDYSCLENKIEEVDDSPHSKFSWKYGKQFHNSFNSFGDLLVSASESKRYSPEEYFELLFTEVKKDSWWKDVITPEMALRKFEFLNYKFGKSIPNKVGGMNEITHIF